MGDAATNQKALPGGKALTPSQLRDLVALYDRLVEISAAAAEALGKAVAVPTGPAYRRFEELDARVAEVARRIQQILK
jgi:hypothetical protein